MSSINLIANPQLSTLDNDKLNKAYQTTLLTRDSIGLPNNAIALSALFFYLTKKLGLPSQWKANQLNGDGDTIRSWIEIGNFIYDFEDGIRDRPNVYHQPTTNTPVYIQNLQIGVALWNQNVAISNHSKDSTFNNLYTLKSQIEFILSTTIFTPKSFDLGDNNDYMFKVAWLFLKSYEIAPNYDQMLEDKVLNQRVYTSWIV